MCPSPLYLQVLAKHEVPITLSSDAHYPNDLGKYVEENVKTLRNHDISHLATFTETSQNDEITRRSNNFKMMRFFDENRSFVQNKKE